MVRADLGSSGVMFTLDTDSGFRDVVFITAGYGLGETLVQGSVNPDEFYVYKPALAAGRSAILRRTLGTKALKMVYAENGAATPVTTVEVPAEDRRRFCISDAEVEELARQAMRIERHYDCPMDIEWAKDGVDGRLRIVQARPETVQSRSGRLIERFTLEQSGRVIAKGRSIGHKIGSGPARVLESVAEIGVVRRGDVLVTDMTDPDWEPVMKISSAIVTNRGGRTCHAAIVARELGHSRGGRLPTGTPPRRSSGWPVTVTLSCAEGDVGKVRVRGPASPYEVRHSPTWTALPEIARHPHHGQPRQPGARAFQISAAIPNRRRRPRPPGVHHQRDTSRRSPAWRCWSTIERVEELRASDRPDRGHDQDLSPIRASTSTSRSSPKGSPRSPPRSPPSRSSCDCPTSSRTSTPT